MPFSIFISKKSQLEDLLEPFFIDLKLGVTTQKKTGHLRRPVNGKDSVLNLNTLPPVHPNKTDT